MLKKNKTKELKKPGLTWYPYIRLQEPNIPAILNPFCRLPMADTEKPKFRRKLPQSLNNHNLSYGRIQLLKSKIENYYLLLNLQKQEDPQLSKFLDQVCTEVVLERKRLFEPGSADSKDQKRAALIKFHDHAAASKWMASASKKDVNLLNNEIIAKMLLSEHLSINFSLGFDNITTEMVKKFLHVHAEELKSILFKENEYEQLMEYMGINVGDHEKPAETELKDKALQLKTHLESTQAAPQT